MFLVFYAMIELGEGCLQKEIANWYFISPQTIHSSVRALEKRGHLYLKPGKRRDMHIYLTDSDRQIMREWLGPIIRMENGIFEAMLPRSRRHELRIMRLWLTRKRIHFAVSPLCKKPTGFSEALTAIAKPYPLRRVFCFCRQTKEPIHRAAKAEGVFASAIF